MPATPFPAPQASLDVIADRLSRLDGALRDHAVEDEDRHQRTGGRFDRVDDALRAKADRSTVEDMDKSIRSTREDVIRGLAEMRTTFKIGSWLVGLGVPFAVLIAEWLLHRGR